MKTIKRILVIGLGLALIFWIGMTLASNKKEIDANAEITETIIGEVPVRIAEVKKMEVDNSLSLTGTFAARKELKINAEGQGRITLLAIEEGQKVSKGQRIAKIDNTTIQAQLKTADASLAKSRKDVERYERLLTAGAISQQQFEDVKLGLANAEANLAAIKQQLNYTTVSSPMTGFIKEIRVEEGSFAAPGMELATVVDINQLKLVVKVPETDIVKIQKGQKVKIFTEVYPDLEFNGRVNLISIQSDQARKYEVEIEINNSKENPLKPGMYGTVSIDLGKGEAAYGLFVPRKSILGSVKNPKVFVVQQDMIVSEKEVQLGEIHEDQVWVLSGLEVGEKVVTSGQINLESGKKVRILNEDKPNEIMK